MGEVDKLIELVMENAITFGEALDLIEALEKETVMFDIGEDVVESIGMSRKIG